MAPHAEAARGETPPQLHGGNVFQTARECGWDWRDILDFSANINPFGPPESALRALQAAVGRVVHYPEDGAPLLRRAAAKAWGLEEPQILAGNGATELLYFLARVVRPSRVHLLVPTFSEFRRAFRDARISATAADPETGRWDLAAVSRDLRQQRPELLVFTDPNNPTGAVFDVSELTDWLLRGTPAETKILADESFLDFRGRRSAAGWVEQRPGLMALRSLTKFYALPGLRAGCLIASRRTIAGLEAQREPWQTNVLAEEAAAAALADEDYRQKSVEFVRAEREWMRAKLAALPGMEPWPSAANFLFVRSRQSVAWLQERLLRHKILIRDCTGMEGVEGQALRVAVRARAENERLLSALREALC